MKVTIIGAGNMGGAIARALAASRSDIKLCVSNPSQGKLNALTEEYPAIEVTNCNLNAATGADVVILAVKPWLIQSVIEEIKPAIDPAGATIVSLAGGLGIDALETMLTNGAASPLILHVIPNTALSAGCSMTFISANRPDAPGVATVKSLFAVMGETALIDEKMMGAATALSSCGIAYVYKFIQAMVQAGVEMGFRPADALHYANMTVLGAARMLIDSNQSPQTEIDRVTTPGGMTIKGINSLENTGFTSSVITSILAPLQK